MPRGFVFDKKHNLSHVGINYVRLWQNMNRTHTHIPTLTIAAYITRVRGGRCLCCTVAMRYTYEAWNWLRFGT